MTQIIFLLFSFLCDSVDNDCSQIKEGVFKMKGSKTGRTYTITRTKYKQTEKTIETGLVTEYDLKWASDCTYLTFNRKVIKGTDYLPVEAKLDTMYNNIVSIHGDSIKVVTKVSGFDQLIENTLIKVGKRKHKDK